MPSYSQNGPWGDRIRVSRERCRAHGPGQTLADQELSSVELTMGNTFLEIARVVCEDLVEHLGGTDVITALVDGTGTILWCGGDPRVVAEMALVGLAPNTDWCERALGTNAIGTCIADAAAIALEGDAHLHESLHGLAGVAVPIAPCAAPASFSDDGKDRQLVGALALYGPVGMALEMSLALVEIYVGIIEGRFLEIADSSGIGVALHRSPMLVSSPRAGRMLLSSGGQLLWRNAAAERLLPIVPGEPFSNGFLATWNQFLGESQSSRGPLELTTTTSTLLYAKVVNSATASTVKGGRSRHGLEHLGNDDARIGEAVRRALRIVERDIPLLIQGETGSGKEWFAQAFHNSGSRRDGPFVAVNCAAIPATLIEAELFGYAEGAFTGARRYGARGKIREADGGTLFLDEIGDMPLALQAVLLRVLETRRVTPLGNDSDEAVNIRLVCASHQPLRELVEQGSFRADLFFRLSGLTIALPPLRERSDFEPVVRRILGEESPQRPVIIDPEALTLLRRYSWPGNLRQLRNVLRLCVALLGPDGVLLPSYLPSEIRSTEPVTSSHGLRDVQARLARESVSRNGGNISAAARELGITRTTLYRLLGMPKRASSQGLNV